MFWGKETRRDSQVIRGALKTKLRALLPGATQITRRGDREQILGYQKNPPLLPPVGLDPDRSWCSVLTCMLSVTSRDKMQRTSEHPQLDMGLRARAATGVPQDPSFLILVIAPLSALPSPLCRH